jgi:2-polyprenyl-6-methoxyphenol hydroxylase-like FAD-dependent oxidoreductase
MYILRDAAAMERTLTDRHGTRHLFSLPPGHIAEDVQSEFLSFINRPDTLAKWPKVREIINLSAQLDKLFVQAVWSYSPHHVAFPSHNTILLGDAAALASPTTTTGTQRCFEDALALVEALKTGKGVKESLERTEEMRVKELRAIVERGIRRVSSIQPFYDALVKL